MEKERAKRNRTLTLTDMDREVLIKRLFIPENNRQLALDQIRNKTILANLYEVIDYLPKNSADLIIIDPPYNLTKNFHGFKFTSSADDEYLEYLRSWFPKIVSVLKPNGSLYLCGDWKCTAALQRVMSENLIVLNRITWQREKGRSASHNWKNGMEDIWFGVKNPKDYYFNVDAVKIKRRVLAPYKENGKPKDWEQTEDGKFRSDGPIQFLGRYQHSLLVDARKHGSPHPKT